MQKEVKDKKKLQPFGRSSWNFKLKQPDAPSLPGLLILKTITTTAEKYF